MKDVQNKNEIDAFVKKLDKPIDDFCKIVSEIFSVNKKSIKTLKSRQEKNINCIQKCDKKEVLNFKKKIVDMMIMKKILDNKKMKKSMMLLINNIFDKNSYESINYSLELLEK